MKPKETWMERGEIVKIPSGRGVITHAIDSIAGFVMPGTDIKIGMRVVHQIWVRPEGVAQAWPYSPDNVDAIEEYSNSANVAA